MEENKAKVKESKSKIDKFTNRLITGILSITIIIICAISRF